MQISAKFETKTAQVLKVPAKTNFVPVAATFCTNLTKPFQTIKRQLRDQPATMRTIDMPGPIKGMLREAMLRTINGYQQSKRLSVDGFLNPDTVKSVGVSPN